MKLKILLILLVLSLIGAYIIISNISKKESDDIVETFDSTESSEDEDILNSTIEADTSNSDITYTIPDEVNLETYDTGENEVKVSENNMQFPEVKIDDLPDLDDINVTLSENTSVNNKIKVHMIEKVTNESGDVVISNEEREKYRAAIIDTFTEKYKINPPEEINVLYSNSDMAYVRWGKDHSSLFNVGIILNPDVEGNYKYIHASEGDFLVNIFYDGEPLGSDKEDNLVKYITYYIGNVGDGMYSYYILTSCDDKYNLKNCDTGEDINITEEDLRLLNIEKWSKNFQELGLDWNYMYANKTLDNITISSDTDYLLIPVELGFANDYKIFTDSINNTVIMQVKTNNDNIITSTWDINGYCVDCQMR